MLSVHSRRPPRQGGDDSAGRYGVARRARGSRCSAAPRWRPPDTRAIPSPRAISTTCEANPLRQRPASGFSQEPSPTQIASTPPDTPCSSFRNPRPFCGVASGPASRTDQPLPSSSTSTVAWEGIVTDQGSRLRARRRAPGRVRPRSCRAVTKDRPARQWIADGQRPALKTWKTAVEGRTPRRSIYDGCRHADGRGTGQHSRRRRPCENRPSQVHRPSDGPEPHRPPSDPIDGVGGLLKITGTPPDRQRAAW